jgi:hypothetical protein
MTILEYYCLRDFPGNWGEEYVINIRINDFSVRVELKITKIEAPVVIFQTFAE